MPRVAAIMPCRGRPEQTIANVHRLLATAGYNDWFLWLSVDDDDDALFQALTDETAQHWSGHVFVEKHTGPRGYWHVLDAMTTTQTNAPLLVNLANDLLASPNWLRNAVSAYDATFGATPGMLGFNGDGYGADHACHFLISRDVLARYGGWPTWYQHNFGDTELCHRAIADGVYAKAPWAVLYHNHWRFGASYDQTYAAGDATFEQDRAMYAARKARGWR